MTKKVDFLTFFRLFVIDKKTKNDKKLKKNGINPGTSADLTVASLFVTLLQECKG